MMSVREEETDWALYHKIQAAQSITCEQLVTDSGLPEEIIAASLQRMERGHLIRQTPEGIRLLSLQEMLFSCRLANTMKDTPFVLENGVIRVKKNGDDSDA
ncbi:hypothetical protein AZH53_04955 [Methanomicrobiaceae archaeon CYW5]|nr:hypothetical protein [Methanovulcanius yangii]